MTDSCKVVNLMIKFFGSSTWQAVCLLRAPAIGSGAQEKAVSLMLDLHQINCKLYLAIAQNAVDVELLTLGLPSDLVKICNQRDIFIDKRYAQVEKSGGIRSNNT